MQSIRRIRTCDTDLGGFRSDAGFSLVELFLSSIVVLILMAAALAVFDVSQRLHNSTEQGLELQQNVRSALGFICRELINAGAGIPYTSSLNGSPPVPVPAGARMGPLGAAIAGTTVCFITPGNNTGETVTRDGEGHTIPTPIRTDMLAFLGGQGDSRFVNQNLPGPTSGWGSSVYLEDNSIFSVGQVVAINNGFHVSLGQITQINPGGEVQFANGVDPLALNPPANSTTPNPNYHTARQIPGGPPPQMFPLSTITYYIDSATNPVRPALKRLSNSSGGAPAGMTVADDIEDFQVQYLVDTDQNATTADVLMDAPSGGELSLVRGAAITIRGRSRALTQDRTNPDRHARLQMSQTVFFRNNIRR